MTKTKKTTKSTKGGRAKMTTGGWIWRLAVSIIIPLAIGGLAAFIAGDAMSAFGSLNKPPLAPPAWLFPVAWTVLYILMGVACFLVWIRTADKQMTATEKTRFMTVYGFQLIFNFFWSIFFFNFGWYWFAFVWLIALWAMVLYLVVWGGKNYHAVMWLLLPYILWNTFAGYLNVMIAILN